MEKFVASLTIRNIPDYIFKQLKALSLLDKRSLNSEILLLIENGIEKVKKMKMKRKKTINKELQLKIWHDLSGSWQDDRDTKEIIDDIYAKRSVGRDINL